MTHGSSATAKLSWKLPHANLMLIVWSPSAGEDDADAAAGASAARLASVSATVFTRLTTHSRFAPLMLSADAGPARLPAAAEKLPLPLASVLPLVEVDGAPEQVRATKQLNMVFPLISISCILV